MSLIKPFLAVAAALCAAQAAHAIPVYSVSTASGLYGLPTTFTASGNAGVASGSIANVYSSPNGLQSGGSYLYVSPGGSITIDVNAPVFSFLWGTPDTYNLVSFDTSEGSFAFSGSQLYSQFNVPTSGTVFSASLAGGTINSVTMTSSGVAFETAVSQVPEPASLALVAGGLGLVALATRRRRKD